MGDGIDGGLPLYTVASLALLIAFLGIQRTAWAKRVSAASLGNAQRIRIVLVGWSFLLAVELVLNGLVRGTTVTGLLLAALAAAAAGLVFALFRLPLIDLLGRAWGKGSNIPGTRKLGRPFASVFIDTFIAGICVWFTFAVLMNLIGAR